MYFRILFFSSKFPIFIHFIYAKGMLLFFLTFLLVVCLNDIIVLIPTPLFLVLVFLENKFSQLTIELVFAYLNLTFKQKFMIFDAKMCIFFLIWHLKKCDDIYILKKIIDEIAVHWVEISSVFHLSSEIYDCVLKDFEFLVL